MLVGELQASKWGVGAQATGRQRQTSTIMVTGNTAWRAEVGCKPPILNKRIKFYIDYQSKITSTSPGPT